METQATLRIYNLLEDHGCPICISDVSPEHAYITDKCVHLFHKKCIIEHFKYSTRCPTCNTENTNNCIDDNRSSVNIGQEIFGMISVEVGGITYNNTSYDNNLYEFELLYNELRDAEIRDNYNNYDQSQIHFNEIRDNYNDESQIELLYNELRDTEIRNNYNYNYDDET
jgi:hypothetical protein